MFLKIGHRGARAYEIENTLESFRKAIELGANAIELDVRRSGDGRLVLSHDDNLKKVFGDDTTVKRATIEQLRLATGNRIATLDDTLQFLRNKVRKVLVELKESGYENEVLGLIRKEEMAESVIVISFLEEALENVRRLNTKIETGLLYTRFRNPIDAAQGLSARYLLPLYRFVHTRDVERAHKNNLKVIAWTINTREEVEDYIAKGVDGIATDRPDVFKGIA